MLHEARDLGRLFEGTYEYRLLRRVFVPKTKEITGGWGKLHTEELHNLVLFDKYYQWNQIEENGMTGACALL
jgi:hypothetical protein